MITSYDLSEMTKLARQWRETAAAAVDDGYHDECVRRAMQCEQLV